MTKKSILMILLLMAMLSLTCTNVYANPTEIPLQVGYVNPDGGDLGQQRGPVFIPSVCIDGYSLVFNTPIDGYTLRLLDEDGYVVFTTIIPIGSTSMVLPSYLSGEYEIQIIHGNLCFYGYIVCN